MAVTDNENQIIIDAQTVGTANECEHLPEMLDRTLENMKKASVKKTKGKKMTLLADANYFSEGNLKACKKLEVEAIIPDGQ
jgi:hypothetical protein